MIPLDQILAAVGLVTGFTPTELQSDAEAAELETARRIYFWLAVRLTSCTAEDIGRPLGVVDGQIVLKGAALIQQRRDESQEYRLYTEAFATSLQQLAARQRLNISGEVDALGAARRILRDPQRQAMRVSVREIIAMAQLIVVLACDDATQSSLSS